MNIYIEKFPFYLNILYTLFISGSASFKFFKIVTNVSIFLNVLDLI